MTPMEAKAVAARPGEAEAVIQPGSAPPVPEMLEDTGLSAPFVSELILRALYMQGTRTGEELEELLKLPFHILDEQLLDLQQRRLVEVLGTRGVGRRHYTFEITGEGRTRTREKLGTSRYVGPAPVTLDTYRAWAKAQKPENLDIGPERVRRGLSHLVLDDTLLDAVGPAINSGRSLFLYGHAGNGKTTIAEAIARMLGDRVYIPYGVEVGGQIISIFDPITHRVVEDDDGSPTFGKGYIRAAPPHDPRFVLVERPAVMVGGELTLDDLELRYDEQTGVFLAPPQVKANGGVFIIDDFGRQRVRPRELLNRWMVPLERRVDFLNMPMGHRLSVPFECLLIYATNLDPSELVEEAFLRRIPYKILVDNPSPAEYREIFRRVCGARGVPYAEEGVELLEREYYKGRGIAPRSCHPRDIVGHLCDLARYRGAEPAMSGDLLREACSTYFLEDPTAGASIGGSEQIGPADEAAPPGLYD